MRKFIVLNIITSFLLCSCSFRTGSSHNIVNENIERFKKEKDFESNDISKYKINGAVICPFFRYETNEKYSAYCSIYSDENNLKTDELILYKLIVTTFGKRKEFKGKLEIEKSFKKITDKYWGDDILFAGFTLFENERIELNKESEIKLILNVKIKNDEEEASKQITYYYKYKTKYFLVDICSNSFVI